MRRIGRLEAMGEDVLVYPDAEEYLQQRLFQERIGGLVADIRRDPARHPLRRELLREELLPYQLDGIAFAVGAGRAILADEMGLGKTIQAIGVAEMLAREAGIRKVLIVTPASLKSQWRGEIRRFCGREALLVNGSAKERTEQYRNDSFYTVCNYEQVIRDIVAVERVAWDLIILDEGQRIKNWETKTSGVIKGLHSTFALVLSGTPLENRLDELFSVVEFIDDRRLGPAFRFFPRHQLRDADGKMFGYQRLDELRERLKPVLLRRTRDSVLSELPPRVTELIRIPPTEEQAELHSGNMRIVVQILNKPYINEMDLLRLRRALMMCRMAANSTALVDKQHPGYSTKLQTLDGLFQQLLGEPDRKIVLFSEWTSMLDLIEPLLKQHEADFVRLDGDVPQRARAALVHQFQNDPNCRLFLTTNAGSTGLNLQAADTVINVDLPWNPAVLEQRIGRAHRMGQTKSVQVYVLVTEGTIEEGLLETLADKQDLALAALDPDSTVTTISFSRSNDDLKKRLERLLGAKPPAPLDESRKYDEQTKAQRLIAGLPATHRGLLAGPTALVSSADATTSADASTADASTADDDGSSGGLRVGVGASQASGLVAGDRAARQASQTHSDPRESLAESGGILISAALDFLGQLLPPQPPSPETQAIAESVAERLRKSVDRDEAGRPRFTLTLPDEATLEKIAATVAALFTRR
jgi:SNF2 family DNA or RNA helicase